MKNDYPLEQTSRVRVLFNNTLAIDRAQSDDSGNYRCRSSNGYKEAEDSVDLVVEDLQVNMVICGISIKLIVFCSRFKMIA